MTSHRDSGKKSGEMKKRKDCLKKISIRKAKSARSMYSDRLKKRKLKARV